MCIGVRYGVQHKFCDYSTDLPDDQPSHTKGFLHSKDVTFVSDRICFGVPHPITMRIKGWNLMFSLRNIVQSW
jgi:hypothetical protein